MAEFKKRKHQHVVKDKDDNDVFLADSAWILKVCREDFPDIRFYTTSEFKGESNGRVKGLTIYTFEYEECHPLGIRLLWTGSQSFCKNPEDRTAPILHCPLP